MKVKLYDEITSAKEKEVTLRLLREDGKVIVAVVDERGRRVSCGTLIQFNNDMTFIRKESVNATLGLPLNEERQLIEVEDD